MSRDKQGHPELEHLERYAMGRLAEPELGAVEEHLLLCEPCQERLDEATVYVSVMREATAKVAAAEPAEAAWKRWLRLDWLPVPAPALAAAMAIVLAALVWQPWRAAAPVEWQTVELEAMRGGAGSRVAVEGFALDLRLDVNGLDAGEATAQIVNAGGAVLAEVPVALLGGKAELRYGPGLKAGQYWVRLRVGGETVREYSLLAKPR